jgi:hypothetical protein
MFSNYRLVNELCPVAYFILVYYSPRYLVMLVLVASSLSGEVRMEYLFCVYFLLLSSKLAANALVWLSNFLQYLTLHFFISRFVCFLFLTSFICRSSWILLFFVYLRCIQNGLESLEFEVLRDFDV